MNTVLTMVRHSGRVCLAILKFCTTQCFLKFSSNPSMKFRQFRVPESMFHILKGERDVFLGISTCFWPLLTMQHYCCGQLVLPRYLSKFFFCFFRVRWSISVIVSALSWLYSLNSLVLNKLFWWYCCRFLLYCRIGLVQALDILTLSCTDSLWHQVGTSSSWIIFPSYSICGTLFYFLWYTYILFQFLDTLFQSSFPPWIFIAFVFPIFSVFCITPSLSIITMPVAFNKQLRSVKFFILIFSIDGKWFSGSSCFSSFLNLLNSRDSS